MKIEKLEERAEEELTKSEEGDLFNSIVRGLDVTEWIKTSRGDFKIKFPRISDIETIGRLTAIRQNELPSQSFDQYVLSLMQKVATLDVLVLEGPAWFENAKKENTNRFTVWQNIPLQSFIEEVYSKTLAFREQVQSRIEQGGEASNKQVATASHTADAGGTKGNK